VDQQIRVYHRAFMKLKVAGLDNNLFTHANDPQD
jgi:hypothetical protein